MDTGTSSTVLVLTYEFPPSAGGGVQRIAKLCTFLPAHGFEPWVICSEPVVGRPSDRTLAAEVAGMAVTRVAAPNPSESVARLLAPFKRIRSAISSRRARITVDEGVSPAHEISPPASARLARMVSDDDASWWSRRAVSAACDLGARSGAAAVLASGPPFSVLVAGGRIAEELGLPLVADMRDGWLTNPGAGTLSRRRKRRAARQQRRVLRMAAAVTCVSEPIATEARDAGACCVELIPNGYDAREMPRLAPVAGPTLRVAFMGRFYGVTDPEPFLTGLALAVSGTDTSPEVRFEVVGPGNARFESLAARLGLAGKVDVCGYLPHDEALARVACADIAVVLISDVAGAEAVYTGKLFEYLGMGIPVLVVGPREGAAASLVRQARAGWVVEPSQTEEIAALIRSLAQYKAAGEPVAVDSDRTVIEGFERGKQAAAFARILGEVCGQTEMKRSDERADG